MTPTAVFSLHTHSQLPYLLQERKSRTPPDQRDAHHAVPGVNSCMPRRVELRRSLLLLPSDASDCPALSSSPAGTCPPVHRSYQRSYFSSACAQLTCLMPGLISLHVAGCHGAAALVKDAISSHASSMGSSDSVPVGPLSRHHRLYKRWSPHRHIPLCSRGREYPCHA